MSNAHCRAWNKARKLTNMENETHKQGPGNIGRTLTNEENEKLSW
jgi:hypothetical protein